MESSRKGAAIKWLILGAPVIGVFLAIVVPLILRTQAKSQSQQCLANLKMLDRAVQSWSLTNKKSPGDAVESSEVAKHLKDGPPTCPSGGSYTFGAVSNQVRCTIHGNAPPKTVIPRSTY